MNLPVVLRQLLFFVLLTGCLVSATQVQIPPLSTRVNDVSGVLTFAQKAAVEQHLAQFELQKGTQLGVLIVPSTAPETIEQFALRVVEKWKLGRKNIDDGALLVVASNDRTMRIEVGYGLEGVLNDAVCKRIISDVIAPFFKQGDFYNGINQGIDTIIADIKQEPLPPPGPELRRSASGQYLPVMFILVLALGGVLRAVLGRFPGAVVAGSITTGLTWLFFGAVPIALLAGILALLLTLLGGGIHSIGNGFYGSGYGSGGGFSGGGGGFGGGGASGRW